MTFGQRLRSLREDKELSQVDFARELKITSQSLSQYELDKRMPDATMLRILADYFNVSIDYLLCRIDNRTQCTSNDKLEIKPYHNINVNGLPEEAIKQIEDYVELMKLKYNPDGTLRKKS